MKGLPRGSVRLLSYYPKYKNDPADSIYEDYCRTWILLLEGPQRTYPTLLVTLYNFRGPYSYTFDTYSDAYRWCRRYYEHYPNLYIVPLQKPSQQVQARIDAEDFEERLDKEDADPTYQDKLNVRCSQYDSNANALGNRDIDINADWSAFVGKYNAEFPNIYLYPQRKYQKEEIALHPAELRIDSQSIDQKDLLNQEQRLLYNIVLAYYRGILDSQNPP